MIRTQLVHRHGAIEHNPNFRPVLWVAEHVSASAVDQSGAAGTRVGGEVRFAEVESRELAGAMSFDQFTKPGAHIFRKIALRM